MDFEILTDYYKTNNFDMQKLPEIAKVLEILDSKYALTEIKDTDFDEFITIWREQSSFDVETFIGVARYFKVVKNNDAVIHLFKYLGSVGVMESIKERFSELESKPLADRIFTTKPFGLTPKELPEVTKNVMNQLIDVLPQNRLENVLAGNHHGLPKAIFLSEKKIFEASESLEAYLLDYHNRKIQELQEFCDENKIWYEQKITQKVVDFAKQNQEIMSAVRSGDSLYVTKIPYNPDAYLDEENKLLKRYYACHCPFVRERILSGETDISEKWCYCSGGFAKFPYEVIFDRPLKVKLLNSALKGDVFCRFEIPLNE